MRFRRVVLRNRRFDLTLADVRFVEVVDAATVVMVEAAFRGTGFLVRPVLPVAKGGKFLATDDAGFGCNFPIR